MFPESVHFRLPALCLAVALTLPGVALSQTDTDKDKKDDSAPAAQPLSQSKDSPSKVDPQQDPLKRPLSDKERRATRSASSRRSAVRTKNGSMRMSAGSSPTKSAPLSSSSRTTKSATSSSKPSGSAATPLRIRSRTNIKKSTTPASPTR